MRTKRSTRKKKMRKRAIYQAASFISIAAFGIAQVTPSSQALFSHSASIRDGEITSSFVFPETIEEIVNEITAEMVKITEARDLAVTINEKLSQAESSDETILDNSTGEVLQTALASQAIAQNKLNDLNILLARGLIEVQEDESAQKILTIIEEAVVTATQLVESINILVSEITELKNQSMSIIMMLIEKEATALEKEMIAEIANKALEGLANSNKLASEILSKYGVELDLAAFQDLTEQLALTETDLQKSVEEAEKYLNELKAYMEGKNEVTSSDVLEEAKLNYIKVQSAIDSLKQTIDYTKTTNSEVQSKIAEEQQRQAEEEARLQQESEKEKIDAGGGGGLNPSTPPTEGEDQLNPNAPTTDEEEQPDPNAQPAEGEEQPDPNAPPAEEGEQLDPNAQPAEGEEQPDPNAPPTEEEEQPDPNVPPAEEEEQPDADAPPTKGEEQPNLDDQQKEPAREEDNEANLGEQESDNDSGEPANGEDENEDAPTSPPTENDSTNSQSSETADNTIATSSQPVTMSQSTMRTTVASSKTKISDHISPSIDQIIFTSNNKKETIHKHEILNLEYLFTHIVHSQGNLLTNDFEIKINRRTLK